jgi:hypothetical protein
VHIGIKGGADRFDDSRASPVVRLLKDQADGTEPRQITDQLLLGQGADDIDRPDIDLAPAALLQDGVDTVAVREGELPRRVGPGRGGSAGAVLRRAQPSS